MPTNVTSIPIGITLLGGTDKSSIKLNVKNLNTGESATVNTNSKGRAIINIGNADSSTFPSGSSAGDVIEIKTHSPGAIGSTIVTLNSQNASRGAKATINQTDTTNSNTVGVTI